LIEIYPIQLKTVPFNIKEYTMSKKTHIGRKVEIIKETDDHLDFSGSFFRSLIYNENKLSQKPGNDFPVNIYNISINVPVNVMIALMNSRNWL